MVRQVPGVTSLRDSLRVHGRHSHMYSLMMLLALLA